MVQFNNNSNSDGDVIGDGVLAEIWTSSSGDFLAMSFRSGILSISIQSKNANFGYCREILSLTLHLLKDGNISGRWGLS